MISRGRIELKLYSLVVNQTFHLSFGFLFNIIINTQPLSNKKSNLYKPMFQMYKQLTHV